MNILFSNILHLKGAHMNKISKIINNNRRLILFSCDLIISIFTYLSAFIFSGLYSYEVAIIKLKIFVQQFWLYSLIYISTFVIFDQYKKMWRYARVQDIYSCLKTSFLANLIYTFITIILGIKIRFYIYIVIFPISMLLSTSIRLVFRSVLIIAQRTKNNDRKAINTMLIGAGDAASSIIRELETNNPDNLDIKCIIDDDKSKIKRKLANIPIVGSTEIIDKYVVQFDISQIIFCIPSCDSKNRKRILDKCAKTACKVKILSNVVNIIQDKNQKLLSNIRDIQIEDLLGRDSIKLNNMLSKKLIENRTVLITGGGGSIGSELSRQVATYNPKSLIIFDIYENNAYNIQQELIRKYKDTLNLSIEIGSVRDKVKLDKLFNKYKIDLVFHAAAHKHVPLMETNPEEAIKNNVIGTYNLSKLAGTYNIEKFVLISTDKAVNPTNIMGATKRIAELIIQYMSTKFNTDYVAVRFGNVLGSNGSVVPLFVNQIKQGGPVTVTHPDITRFFMTIPEAVSLVLQAAAIASGGEIFVLDMGQPVKIIDLANNLIRLSGLEPNIDIPIVFSGLRPGEKLYEELLIKKDDNQIKTHIDKIFIEKPIDYSNGNLEDDIKSLQSAANNLNYNEELKLIKKMVPSYVNKNR